MVNQASTVMDIEYQMVLDNIAMFECNPASLPWHVRINDGVVQVNDSGGVVGLGVQWGSSPNFTRGPQALAKRDRTMGRRCGHESADRQETARRVSPSHRFAAGARSDFFQRGR